MKIPKFKPPGNSERNESYLSILVLMLAVFMLVLIGIVSQGATVHAANADFPYSFSLDYQYVQAADGLPAYDRSCSIISRYPIYGYYKGGEWRFSMVDFENQIYYNLSAASSDDDINAMYRIESAHINFNSNSGDVTTTLDYSGGGTYQLVSSEYSGVSNCIKATLNDWSFVRICTATVFESEDALKAFMQTGELVGVIHEGDVTTDGRDFGGEYDPDVPIPQLKNITHNGFDIVGGSDSLELDLVVKSTFYGLIHNTVDSSSKGIFLRDVSAVYNTHYYDAGTSDVGFYGSKGSFNLRDDFGIENYNDLVADGARYFLTYPTQKDLPSYNWMKHNSTVFNTAFTQQKGCYIDNGGLTEQVVSNRSVQMETKYYVRYYQINEDGTYTPGQWYSYTFGKKSDNLAYPDVTISPVGGDEDGNPIDKDPIEGGQDENGDIIITDPTDPGQWDNEGTLLSMIRDLLGNWQEMITYYQQFGSFLAITLDFIPGAVWESIILGIRISVLCMVWRFVIR